MMRPNLKDAKAIVGLGNPTSKYKDTYHNVGKLFLDYIARDMSKSQASWRKYKDLFEYSKLQKTNKILIKTLTYMNMSGAAVEQSSKNFEYDAATLVVAHDDADITLGQYKLSFARGSAGHKGVQSIIDHLGTKEFWRVRIGIRHQEDTRQSSKFVLEKINDENHKRLESVFVDLKKSLFSQ